MLSRFLQLPCRRPPAQVYPQPAPGHCLNSVRRHPLPVQGLSILFTCARSCCLCSFIVRNLLESSYSTFGRMHLRLPETCRTTFRTTVLDLTFQSDVHSSHLWSLVRRLWRRVPGITNPSQSAFPVPSLFLWAPLDGSTQAHSRRCSNVVFI